MKPKRSCEACRQRHRKCITRPQATTCNGCDELGRECTLTPPLQFLPWKAKAAGKARVDADPSSPSALAGGTDLAQTPRSQGLPSPLHGNESLGSPVSQRRESIVISNPHQPSTSSLLSKREAFLFRTWVQKISLISDATDDARHFAITVSRLALEHPVLLNGILGLASRFDSLATGGPEAGEDLESAFYHGRCIELLINLLNRPVETYDDVLLAAVVLSRLYEENDTHTDSLTYHLAGTSTLLGHEVITRLAAEGGLAEAACWVHLRQALYVAIVHRQHPQIPLRLYENLTAFRRADDTSFGNRAVYLFARIVLRYFPEQCTEQILPQQEDTWTVLEEELSTWFQTKPVSFEPIYHTPPSASTGEPFPCIWMASTAAAVALQYYYSGMIVINLHRCHSTPTTGFEATKSRRTSEKCITAHLCALMGLALSNDQAMNAWYLPCHMLHLCGYLLQNPIERAHTVQYLQTVNRQIQWKTAPVIAALTEQWAELDGHAAEME
ncbi:uncharacterized protein B0I36DRAFT_397704 [Microdochium trichocladiopsis]|uniref:Zn(2)-C6 fungal-type domain-containing protein n=1 Tax=Microdochium trichocladiopsis TaxID=1682393 RepID=A0A9P8XUY9_9PEZI|nr:uncharacterized protein B0I36DRAFT_397704 [Microdochium trichocladiopsis]KAH7014233.1 hypothetical protein B0I36DRAFT_397704 [Microdochium trichocladiopsis]